MTRYQAQVLPSELVYTLPTSSAILDLELFLPVEDEDSSNVVLAATSTGEVIQLKILVEPKLGIEILETYSFFPPQTLVLSITLKPWRTGLLALTLSTGAVAYVRLGRHPDLEAEIIHHSMVAHEGREAWCATFGNNGRVLYSGGDDACLRLVDTSKEELFSPEKPTLKVAAGITSILRLPVPEIIQHIDFLLIGSYSAHSLDRNLAIYCHDHLNDHSEKVSGIGESLAVNGGVWRISLISTEPHEEKIAVDPEDRFEMVYRVLASCMHAGAQVFEVRAAFDNALEKEDSHDSIPYSDPPEGPRKRKLACHWKITQLAEFTEHESMCYGGVAQTLPDTKEVRCATISFYDRKLCIWRYP